MLGGGGAKETKWYQDAWGELSSHLPISVQQSSLGGARSGGRCLTVAARDARVRHLAGDLVEARHADHLGDRDSTTRRANGFKLSQDLWGRLHSHAPSDCDGIEVEHHGHLSNNGGVRKAGALAGCRQDVPDKQPCPSIITAAPEGGGPCHAALLARLPHMPPELQLRSLPISPQHIPAYSIHQSPPTAYPRLDLP